MPKPSDWIGGITLLVFLGTMPFLLPIMAEFVR
jgi:hypothetical protein